MLINTSKSQKISDSLENFYINDWQKNGRKIRTKTLYLVSLGLQRANRGLTKLEKQSQYNKPSFYLLVRPQDLKKLCWSSKKLMALF